MTKFWNKVPLVEGVKVFKTVTPGVVAEGTVVECEKANDSYVVKIEVTDVHGIGAEARVEKK